MASTYLTRSLASTNTSWTFSAWVKRSGISANNYLISWGNSGTDGTGIGFDSGDNFFYYSEDGGSNRLRETSAVYRDTSAWYHVVVKSDANAITLYVNGEEPTQSWVVGSSANPLDTSTMAIGKWVTSAYYHNGSMAHVHFIDGTAYSPSDFGETDATTGIWKPKTAPSVTYGTNGFFLKFENSGAFGTDSSGNGNTFTVNGTMTQTIDTPSNVFSTLNPLSKSNATLTNGNTTGALTTNTDRFIPASTLKVSQGKWYAEFKLNSLTSHTGVGITGDEGKASNNNNAIGKETNSYAYVSTDGNFYDADSGSSYGNTYTANDIIGVALDLDNNYIYFSKNGTWQNSGDPTSGATGTGGEAITDPASVPDGVYAMGVGSHSTGGVCNWSANFGNGYFGTTAVSSAQNPDDGIGIFEYDVPAGYRALCTKSINAQEYD